MIASMTISKALKKLFNPDGITICQNGGKFNDLTHYHMLNQFFAFQVDRMVISKSRIRNSIIAFNILSRPDTICCKLEQTHRREYPDSNRGIRVLQTHAFPLGYTPLRISGIQTYSRLKIFLNML